ncbi:FAD dependent oxidoreductase [Russula ochroleuca]|uniref:FAD dependent oxidoreductase n=1 Tax=Russula ochroleuca TaxID=152965 RepID=A0A9P5TDW8_9AGAM|nr:FAD dependent oxidoreductase [Russula ochroleuca]
MALRTLLLGASSLALLSYGQPEALENHNSSDLLCTCNQIAAAISDASQVSFPFAPEYLSDIEHATPSSAKASACSVEPGSAEDVGEILRILGSTRTPFAVKGGGHSMNPGFSSTTGVQIAMTRFNQTKLNSMTSTVDVGAGLIWDQVYKTLEPTGVNVLGGRIPGIGVAGLTLGGGYSFLSSQYGLTLDNVAGYELVLPNGTVTNVTSDEDDLWFGLRGGLNNFGIVTRFIFKSYPQGDVWGGIHFYSENQLDAIKEAFIKYQQKNDTKAEVAVSLSYSSGQILCTILFFYDAPAPSGVFDDLLDIPAIGGNVSTGSFFDYFQSLGTQGGFDGHRVFGDTVSVIQYSPAVFNAFVDQTKLWGARLWALDENATLTLTQEPFDKGIFSHGSESAYPPDRSHAIFPSSLTFEWSNASLDDTMAFALHNISNSIRAAALADGQDVSHAALYPNYALFGTPLEDMYGGNVERLRKIRAAIDPEDVMGLAGGWKF